MESFGDAFAGVAYLVGFTFMWKDLGRWRELFDATKSNCASGHGKFGKWQVSTMKSCGICYVV